MAQIVVDLNGVLVSVNERARTLFDMNIKDVGSPLRDLEISYRPSELRSLIERCYAERRIIIVRNIERHSSDVEIQYLDVQVAPLYDESTVLLGVSIIFEDVTSLIRSKQEIQRAREELETAYEELQSTNEELETTNEELQSTIEELETTNEELQSTNEESETMNEELQSTNEELQTMNDELRLRSNELNQVNAILESILSGLRVGVVVVNRNLDILIWNRKSEDLWGLRFGEVQNQNFLNLDIGLPVEQLKEPIQACLSEDRATQHEVMVEANNRRGKTIKCRVVCTPLTMSEKDSYGVILLMEELNPRKRNKK